MSTCISQHGEYSEHEPGDYCPLCGAFNELAILDERDSLRAIVARIKELMASPFPPNEFYVNGFRDQYDALAEFYDDKFSDDLYMILEPPA